MSFRVSHLEAFRQFERDEDMSLDDLRNSMYGNVTSQAMEVGTAFHKALELMPLGVDGMSSIHADNYSFQFDQNIEVPLPPIRELRLSKTWLIDGEPITISGCVDAFDGWTIYDHKTTSRVDTERYLSGYQWRLYLDMFKARKFQWNVFELRQLDSSLYEVCDVHHLTQFAYPGLSMDCSELVSRFARFVREHL